MIIVPTKNLYLPERKWGQKKFQRGIICAGAIFGGVEWSMLGFGTSYADTGPLTDEYAVNVVFRTDQTVDVLRDVDTDLTEEVNPFVTVTPTTNTWVKCTYVSGDHMTGGAAEDTWWNVDVARSFLMRYQTTGSGPDTKEGVFHFGLSSDSSGTPLEVEVQNVTITVGDIF